jgi:hypothetical protein
MDKSTDIAIMNRSVENTATVHIRDVVSQARKRKTENEKKKII